MSPFVPMWIAMVVGVGIVIAFILISSRLSELDRQIIEIDREAEQHRERQSRLPGDRCTGMLILTAATDVDVDHQAGHSISQRREHLSMRIRNWSFLRIIVLVLLMFCILIAVASIFKVAAMEHMKQ